MNKDPKIFFEHIIESINLIEEYVKGYKEQDFLQSIKLQDLIARRLEIIGEAVKHIPDNIRKQSNSIEWKKIAGMRDYLIHVYFGIDLKLMWKVIENDIPKLKTEIQKIYSNL